MDLYVLARSAGMMGKIAAGHGQIDSLPFMFSHPDDDDDDLFLSWWTFPFMAINYGGASSFAIFNYWEKKKTKKFIWFLPFFLILFSVSQQLKVYII